MINIHIDVNLEPLDSLKRELKKIFRKAMTAASRILRDTIKDNADEVKRLGYLKKSIGIRIRTYRGTVVAIVGPRSKLTWSIGTYKKGKHKGQAIIIAPSKYLHLIERGTKRSKAKPVLEPAKTSTEGRLMEELSNQIRIGIEQALKKM
jgi:HK97 gp10 family phage protein